MGTRNLTMVWSDNQMRVAQYGQWDGYPECNGVRVLEFVKEHTVDEMKKIFSKTLLLDESEYICFLAKAALGKEIAVSEITDDLCKQLNEHEFVKTKVFPIKTRDNGAKILNLIEEWDETIDGPIPLRDHTNFIHDSLFCEWAYLIDLDNECLEVYRGFNKDHLSDTGRFEHKFCDSYAKENGYTTCRLLHTYKLDNLPKEQTFIDELTKLYDDRTDCMIEIIKDTNHNGKYDNRYFISYDDKEIGTLYESKRSDKCTVYINGIEAKFASTIGARRFITTLVKNVVPNDD